jgi:CHASE2 domain-containing sensor protein
MVLRMKPWFHLKLKPLQGQRLLRLLAPFGVSLGCLGAFQVSGIGESLNLLIYDTAVVLRTAPAGSRWPIRLIGLTEADIRRFGWPLQDGLMVRAIDRLHGGIDNVQTGHCFGMIL